MIKFLLIGIIYFLSPQVSATAQIKSIKICTPDWKYYSQRDGKGLYHELLNAIFITAGVEVKIEYAPFKRCETRFNSEDKFDAYVGGYGIEGVIVPKWHIGIDLLTVVYSKGSLTKWNGQVSLKNKRVAWARGYNFDVYEIITESVIVVEYNHLDSAVKMLALDRIDFVIDYEQDIRSTIENLNLTDQLTILPNVISGRKYYISFTDTEKGRQLIDLWDLGMERLHQSGKLQEMYVAWGDLSY